MRVRRAVVADIPWLLVQTIAFCAEHKVPCEPNSMRALIEQLVMKHYVIIADEAGVAMGMLLASKTRHSYDPRLTMLTELGWWVPHEFRHLAVGGALLDTFTAYGKENADIVTMSLMSDSPINTASLTKRGYKQRETAWVLEN